MSLLMGLQLHEKYKREVVAEIVGKKYGRYWQQGIVRAGSDFLIFVTLDKSRHPPKARYKDKFLSPREFEWQSQNQDSRNGRGAKYQNRGVEDLHFHLFVRLHSLNEDGESSPFTYLGIVRFDSWEGDNPITITWRLDELAPAQLLLELKGPHP
jgi:hypothetical protein